MTDEDFLTQLRRVNTERYLAWVGDGEDAGMLFDAAELGGEVGELLNVVKKLEREERGWRGSRSAPEDFADECADVLICLDKLARRRGVNLIEATIRKFNATSVKVDLPQRLVAKAFAATTARPTERGAVEERDKLIEHLTREFGDSYDCTRVWSAWSVGTMGEDDFSPINDRVCEIADGILDALTPPVTVAATDQAGEVEKALADAAERFETIRLTLVNHLNEPVRTAFWCAVEGKKRLAALDTQPATGRTMGGEVGA